MRLYDALDEETRGGQLLGRAQGGAPDPLCRPVVAARREPGEAPLRDRAGTPHKVTDRLLQRIVPGPCKEEVE